MPEVTTLWEKSISINAWIGFENFLKVVPDYRFLELQLGICFSQKYDCRAKKSCHISSTWHAHSIQGIYEPTVMIKYFVLGLPSFPLIWRRYWLRIYLPHDGAVVRRLWPKVEAGICYLPCPTDIHSSCRAI